ncbi:MAG: hypothetical protein L0170_00180 [Acidobacteria bacterium]|nr:hypothetical protein [Acidobacteriota bacterium]
MLRAARLGGIGVETFIILSLKVLAFYLGAGLGWAVWFHFRGLRRVDPGIEGAGFLFRLFITPGLVALWPLMAARCLGPAGNREILGGSDSPVPPRALRSIHFRLAQLLLLFIPLALGLTVTLRPSSSPGRAESPPGVPVSIPDPLSFSDRASPQVPAGLLSAQRPQDSEWAANLRSDFSGDEVPVPFPVAAASAAVRPLSQPESPTRSPTHPLTRWGR